MIRKFGILFAFFIVIVAMAILAPGPLLAQDEAPSTLPDPTTEIVETAPDDVSQIIELYRDTNSVWERLFYIVGLVIVVGIIAVAVFGREALKRFIEASQRAGTNENLIVNGLATLPKLTPRFQGDDIVAAILLENLGHPDLAETLRGRMAAAQKAKPPDKIGGGGISKSDV